MRTSKLSFDEIQKAEEVSAARKDTRGTGIKLRRDRDMGYKRLSNGAQLQWHVPDFDTEGLPTHTVDGTPIFYQISNGVPPNCVKIDGKLYDTEELLKWLRWA